MSTIASNHKEGVSITIRFNNRISFWKYSSPLISLNFLKYIVILKVVPSEWSLPGSSWHRRCQWHEKRHHLTVWVSTMWNSLYLETCFKASVKWCNASKAKLFVQSRNEYLWDRKTRFVLPDAIQSHTLFLTRELRNPLQEVICCSAGPMKAALPRPLTGELSHDGKSTLRYLKMHLFHKLPQLPLFGSL